MKARGVDVRMMVRGVLFLSLALLLNCAAAWASGPWIGSAWRFRVPVTVAVGSYERLDMPAEVPMNFTQLMTGFGFSGTFIENSLRVVEVDGTGSLVDTTVGWQFDKDADYSASSKASGTIVIIIKGTTTAGTTRTYHVYFHGGTGAFPPANVPAQVTLTDNILDEGQSCFRIQANGSTYYYQKQGAGFSSLVDANGNDWIGFHPTVGSGGDGEWRGLPNSGPAFHPGYTNSTSSIVHTGPVKAAFRGVGVSGSGKNYECLWEIYPRFARMTMTRADSNYWFLYEGTPGGGTDPSTLFMYKSNGTQYTLTQSWNGDLVTDEWAYFSNPTEVTGGRSIFVAHVEDDAATDTYWPMYPSSGWSGHMTVFGFGRDNPGDHWLLTGAPQHFTIGLMEGTQFSTCSKIVYGSYKTMTITPGAAEQQQQIAAPLAVSPASGATGLSSSVQFSWTRVTGASTYHLQVGLDSTFTSPLTFDDSAIVDSTASVGSLHGGAVYFWRVSGSGNGVTGPWSATTMFSTVLSSPALSNPLNGANVSTLTPTLNWGAVSYAVAYRLQVSTDSTFTGAVFVDEWNSGATSRVLPTLSEATKYYWRVAARTTQVTSSFSGTWHFRAPQVIVAPTTLQPVNGATGLSTSELFAWMRVAGAITYHLQISIDSTFAGGFVKNDSTIVDTSRTVLGLAKGTRYFWRVQSKFATGDGPYSPTWWFMTAYQLPGQAVPLSPVPFAHINTDSGTFVWTRAQPNVTHYWLEIGLDSNFAFSFIDSTIIDTTGTVKIQARTKWYWWRVRGANLGGWGPFSDVHNFYADPVAGLSRENEIPHQLSLEQNYPNPFNPSTRIRFALPSEERVRIEVYSVLGERVATLVDDRLSAGVYTVEMDAARLASGVYYYRLVTPESSIIKKMLLVR